MRHALHCTTLAIALSLTLVACQARQDEGDAAPAKAATHSVAPAASVSASPKASASIPATPSVAPEAPGGVVAAQVIRQRDESPTGERPIHYRELALAYLGGTR